MPRNYTKIKQYEKEILELREEGFSGREIQEKLGLTKKQYENFINRYNRKQNKILKDMPLKSKGRPPKNCDISEEDEVKRLKRKIKSLEMENELMKNFISLVERK